MNWNEVYEWLKSHNHVHEKWDCIAFDIDSFYAEDKLENTFISIFFRGGDELVFIVGCMRPKVSVGGSTGYHVSNCWDVIDFLEENLEDMYDELMKKVMNEVNG